MTAKKLPYGFPSLTQAIPPDLEKKTAAALRQMTQQFDIGMKKYAQLINGNMQYLAPVGMMSQFGAAPGEAWIQCNGASLSTAGFADLFAVIGYTYGGSGSTFKVPNQAGYWIKS